MGLKEKIVAQVRGTGAGMAIVAGAGAFLNFLSFAMFTWTLPVGPGGRKILYGLNDMQLIRLFVFLNVISLLFISISGVMFRRMHRSGLKLAKISTITMIIYILGIVVSVVLLLVKEDAPAGFLIALPIVVLLFEIPFILLLRFLLRSNVSKIFKRVLD